MPVALCTGSAVIGAGATRSEAWDAARSWYAQSMAAADAVAMATALRPHPCTAALLEAVRLHPASVAFQLRADGVADVLTRDP